MLPPCIELSLLSPPSTFEEPPPPPPCSQHLWETLTNIHKIYERLFPREFFLALPAPSISESIKITIKLNF